MRKLLALVVLSSAVAVLASCGTDPVDTTTAPLINGEDCSKCCTFTQGYWKNHPDDWPVTAYTLGTVYYDKAQLLAILNEPVSGNGLVALAHQLIAAKLNVDSSSCKTLAGARAHALIGANVIPPDGSGWLAPSTTSSLVEELTSFNESSPCTE